MSEEARFYPTDNVLVRKFYEASTGGSCGPSAIAVLERKNVQEILDSWLGIGSNAFRGFSPIREMQATLEKLGYKVTRKRGLKARTFPYPESDKAIIRIQWMKENGEPYHWREAAQHSHYVAMQKFANGWWVFCNSDLWFKAHEQEGVRYLNARVVIGYISSYLELSKS